MIIKIISEHPSYEEETNEYTGAPSAVRIFILNHSKVVNDLIFDILSDYPIKDKGIVFDNCVISDLCSNFDSKKISLLKDFFRQYAKKYNLNLKHIYFRKVKMVKVNGYKNAFNFEYTGEFKKYEL